MEEPLHSEPEQLLLQRLLEAFRHGQDQLGEALQAARAELTPSLAEQASDYYVAAFQQQDANAAIAAAIVGSRIYNFIGDREAAFNSFLDYLNVLYQLAATEDAYANVHEVLSQMLARDPYGDGSSLTGLRAAIMGGDSAFFACEAAQDDPRKQHWLQAALGDLVSGVRFLADPVSRPLIPAFTSTAAAVYRRCVMQHWIGEPWAASGLATLTAALDQAIPLRVIYPGNDAKTDNISEARAEMSTLYNRSAYTGDPPDGTPISGLFGRKS